MPAAGAVAAIYDSLVWVFNSIGQFQGLLQVATDVVNQIGAVVNGQTAQLASSITTFLNGVIPIGINFIAAQLDLLTLPTKVSEFIQEVRQAPTNALVAGIGYLKTKALEYLGLNGAPEYDGLIGQPLTFNVNGQTHRLWVVNVNGKAVVMRASNPAPLNLTQDLGPGVSAAAAAQIQNDVNTLVAAANQDVQLLKTSTTPPASAAVTQANASVNSAEGTLSNDLLSNNAACFGGACFAAGTPLLTPTGSKLIERFEVGDLVLSRSERRPEGAIEAKAVEEVFVRTGRLFEVTAGGRVIRTTGEHPFWACGKGWTRADELTAEDDLLGADGVLTAVEACRDTGTYGKVYNLRVADYHTYFVGDEANAVWAHNANCAHHVLVPGSTPSTYDLVIYQQAGWSASQIAEANAKVQAINAAPNKVVVHDPVRKGLEQKKFRTVNELTGTYNDADHIIDLQLSGPDTQSNLWALDASVNRSMGSSIRAAMVGLPDGTPVRNLIMEART